MKLIILSILFCGALAGNYGGYGPGYGRGHGYGYGRVHGAYGYGGLYQKVRSHYGNTKFAYNDGLSTREEHISYDGSKVGSYSVKNADGTLRTVKYKAGKDGFQVLGDDGSVKEDNVARAAALAEKAAELAKEAPEAPEVPEVPEADLPVAPTNAPDYGKRNQDVYEARKKYYGHKHHGYGGYGYGGYGHGGYANAGYGYAKSYTYDKAVYPAGYGYGGYAQKGYGYGGYGYGKCYNHEEGVWEACKEKKEVKEEYGYGHGYAHKGYGYGGYAHKGYGYGGYGYGKCYNHEEGVWEACKDKKEVKEEYGYGRGGYAHKGYGYGKCYNHEKGVWEACKEKKDAHGYGYGGYGYAAPAASYGYTVAHRPVYKAAYKW